MLDTDRELLLDALARIETIARQTRQVVEGRGAEVSPSPDPPPYERRSDFMPEGWAAWVNGRQIRKSSIGGRALALDDLVEFLRDNPRATIAQMGEAIGRGKETVQDYLRELADNGRIEHHHGFNPIIGADPGPDNRGLGKLQQRVLTELAAAGGALEIGDLQAIVLGDDAGKTARNNFSQQTIRGLIKRGLVHEQRRPDDSGRSLRFIEVTP